MHVFNTRIIAMLIKMDEGRWDIIKLGTQRCRCLEPEPSTELPISRKTAETKAVYKPSNLINRAVIQNDHRHALWTAQI